MPDLSSANDTRVHRPREEGSVRQEGREGRGKEKKRRGGGERREEDRSRRKPFDLSLLLSIFVFSSFLVEDLVPFGEQTRNPPKFETKWKLLSSRARR